MADLEFPGMVLRKPKLASSNNPTTAAPDVLVTNRTTYTNVILTPEDAREYLLFAANKANVASPPDTQTFSTTGGSGTYILGIDVSVTLLDVRVSAVSVNYSFNSRTNTVTLATPPGPSEPVEIDYEYQRPRFHWVKNDSTKTRFKWNATFQRWSPMPGAAPALLGEMVEDFQPNLLPLQDSTIPVYVWVTAPNLADGGVLLTESSVANDAALDALIPPFPTQVVWSEESGRARFDPTVEDTYNGSNVYFNRQQFYDFGDSTGALIEISNGPRPTLSPIPSGVEYPLIRPGFGDYFLTAQVATDSGFGTPPRGTVEYSLQSGALNFHPDDVTEFAGKIIYFDGVLNSKDPVEMDAPVLLGTITPVFVPTVTRSVVEDRPEFVLFVEDGTAWDTVRYRTLDGLLIPGLFLKRGVAEISLENDPSRIELSFADRIKHDQKDLYYTLGDVQVEAGIALRIFRSRADLTNERNIPDIQNEGQFDQFILNESVSAQAETFFDQPPIETGDVEDQFVLIQGLLRTDIGIQDVDAHYDFSRRSIKWLDQETAVSRIELPTVGTDLPATSLNPDAPDNTFELNEGSGYVPLINGQNAIFDYEAGTIIFSEEVGCVRAEGAQGEVVEPNRFNDSTQDFTAAGVQPGDYLHILSGEYQGFWYITNVSPISLRVGNHTGPFAPPPGNVIGWIPQTLDENVAYEVLCIGEVLVDTVFIPREFQIETITVEKITDLGTITNAPRLSIPIAQDKPFQITVDGQPLSNQIVQTVGLGQATNDPRITVPEIPGQPFDIILDGTTATVVDVPTPFSYTDPAILPAGTVERALSNNELNFSALDQGQNVVFQADWTPPATLAAGTVEYNYESGELNFSDADITSGGEVINTETLRSSAGDFNFVPEGGYLFLEQPLLAYQKVRIQYEQADDTGAPTGNTFDEIMPVFVRAEAATFTPGDNSATFNPTGRTVVPGSIQAYINGVQRAFVPNVGTSTVVFPNRTLQATDTVRVTYGVEEGFGGEKAFTTANPPVYRPKLFINEGDTSIQTSGDVTFDFWNGYYLLLAGELFQITNVSYDAGSDISTVEFYPPAPSTLIFPPSFVTSREVTSLTTVLVAFDPIAAGENVIRIHGNATAVFRPGSIITVDGLPFLVGSVELSEDNLFTILATTARFPTEFPTTATIRVSETPVYPQEATQFALSRGIVLSEDFAVVRFPYGEPGQELSTPLDFRITDGGDVLLNPAEQGPIQQEERILVWYTATRVVGPTIQNGVRVIPRFRSTFRRFTVPSEENAILGAALEANYFFRNPDSFYFRTVRLEDYIGEVLTEIRTALQSTGTGGPTVINVSDPENEEVGTESLIFEEGDLYDQDRAVRKILAYYNGVIEQWETLREAVNGQQIGDKDGIFRFQIPAYPNPGSEDPITGRLLPRDVWEILYGDPPDVPFDPGTPQNFFNRREAQRDAVINDIDDIVLTKPGPTLPTPPPSPFPFPLFFGTRVPFWNPSVLSRFYPERRKVFNVTMEGPYSWPETTGTPIMELDLPRITATLQITPRSARARVIAPAKAGDLVVKAVMESIDLVNLPIDPTTSEPYFEYDLSGIQAMYNPPGDPSGVSNPNGTPNLLEGDPVMFVPGFRDGQKLGYGIAGGAAIVPGGSINGNHVGPDNSSDLIDDSTNPIVLTGSGVVSPSLTEIKIEQTPITNALMKVDYTSPSPSPAGSFRITSTSGPNVGYTGRITAGNTLTKEFTVTPAFPGLNPAGDTWEADFGPFAAGGTVNGDPIWNLSDLSKGTVNASGVKTTNWPGDTVTATLTGGTDNDWDIGDSYYVLPSEGGNIEIDPNWSATPATAITELALLAGSEGLPVDLNIGDTIFTAPALVKDPLKVPPLNPQLGEYPNVYRPGIDVFVDRKEGQLVDNHIPPFLLPFFPNIPPEPNQPLNVIASTVNQATDPYRFPALNGEDKDDSGDRNPPFQFNGDNEVFALRQEAALLDGLDSIGPEERSGALGDTTRLDTLTQVGEDFTAAPVVRQGDPIFIQSGSGLSQNGYEVGAVNALEIDRVAGSAFPESAINIPYTITSGLMTGTGGAIAASTFRRDGGPSPGGRPDFSTLTGTETLNIIAGPNIGYTGTIVVLVDSETVSVTPATLTFPSAGDVYEFVDATATGTIQPGRADFTDDAGRDLISANGTLTLTGPPGGSYTIEATLDYPGRIRTTAFSAGLTNLTWAVDPTTDRVTGQTGDFDTGGTILVVDPGIQDIEPGDWIVTDDSSAGAAAGTYLVASVAQDTPTPGDTTITIDDTWGATDSAGTHAIGATVGSVTFDVRQGRRLGSGLLRIQALLQEIWAIYTTDPYAVWPVLDQLYRDEIEATVADQVVAASTGDIDLVDDLIFKDATAGIFDDVLADDFLIIEETTTANRWYWRITNVDAGAGELTVDEVHLFPHPTLGTTVPFQTIESNITYRVMRQQDLFVERTADLLYFERQVVLALLDAIVDLDPYFVHDISNLLGTGAPPDALLDAFKDGLLEYRRQWIGDDVGITPFTTTLLDEITAVLNSTDALYDVRFAYIKSRIALRDGTLPNIDRFNEERERREQEDLDNLLRLVASGEDV